MRKNAHEPHNVRYNGGPAVQPFVADWLDGELGRVAEVEGLHKCTLATLLTRIAKAKLDLTIQSIERYKALTNGHQAKKHRAGDSSDG